MAGRNAELLEMVGLVQIRRQLLTISSEQPINPEHVFVVVNGRIRTRRKHLQKSVEYTVDATTVDDDSIVAAKIA